ncbi:MAG TPA: ABC transporter permease [Bryobacteraceae bacterium]|nr:ABC transporter permease [Bryobacteraceae bacterium]
MITSFELFVAGRYLRARRKEKVISVITVISVVGVAAGVMALIISLAVNNGFQNTLQRNMLAATAHVNILNKDPGVGMEDWRNLLEKLRKIPHVVAVAPVLYDQVILSGPQGTKLITLKGIDVRDELSTSETLRHLKKGSLDRLKEDNGLPGVVIGSKLAQDNGLVLNNVITLIDPQGTLTPFGPGPRSQRFRVAGIFETNFFDVDDTWAYASIAGVQRLRSSIGDVVNTIEMRLDNPDLAPEIADEAARVAGPRYTSITWQDQNRQLFHALKLERVVTAITIGLIELVGALNILITLTMIVLTKYKDIAVLMSMGARRGQIRRIFVMQGAMIGVIGTVIGLVIGYVFCYFAGQYHWIPLDESVYALSYVPFDPRLLDAVWITAVALGVSLLATLYPARNATRITPVEVLRYE